jgi:hypothetical protein
VEYGVGQSKTHRRSIPEKGTKHQVTLAGLSPNETYSFVVSSTDSSGNRSVHSSIAEVALAEPSREKGMFALVVDWFIDQAIAQGGSLAGFSTNAAADTTEPLITAGPEIVESTSDYILLRWITDEATNSRVEFGLSGGLLEHVVGDINYGTEHLMVLPNLMPNTAYDVQVFSVDVAGNSVESAIHTMMSGAQIDVQAPDFTMSPEINTVSESEVIAIWGTDEYSISQLKCVIVGAASTWQTGIEGLRKNHTLHMTGLEVGQEYECQVSSEDISGNTVTSSVSAILMVAQATNTDGSLASTDPGPGTTISTDSVINSPDGGGGSLHPLYLLFIAIYIGVFSRYLRRR